MPEAALAAAIEPYLPIVRLMVLAGVNLAQRQRLIQRVEAALRSESRIFQPRVRAGVARRSDPPGSAMD